MIPNNIVKISKELILKENWDKSWNVPYFLRVGSTWIYGQLYFRMTMDHWLPCSFHFPLLNGSNCCSYSGTLPHCFTLMAVGWGSKLPLQIEKRCAWEASSTSRLEAGPETQELGADAIIGKDLVTLVGCVGVASHRMDVNCGGQREEWCSLQDGHHQFFFSSCTYMLFHIPVVISRLNLWLTL